MMLGYIIRCETAMINKQVINGVMAKSSPARIRTLDIDVGVKVNVYKLQSSKNKLIRSDESQIRTGEIFFTKNEGNLLSFESSKKILLDYFEQMQTLPQRTQS